MSMPSARPLVRDLDPAGAAQADACLHGEPAFLALPKSDLHLQLDGEAGRAMLQHLAYLVRRSRGDLLSHARRVLLAHRLGDSATSCAALVDLACALEDKGLALRQTLLDEIAPALDPACHTRLLALLTRAPRDDECEATAGSLLRPVRAGAALVRRRVVASDGD